MTLDQSACLRLTHPTGTIVRVTCSGGDGGKICLEEGQHIEFLFYATSSKTEVGAPETHQRISASQKGRYVGVPEVRLQGFPRRHHWSSSNPICCGARHY